MRSLYKLLLAYLLLLLPNFLFAQNLVPKSSFEDTTHCPFGPGNIDASAGWFSGSASTDFYHPCSNSMNNHVGVPNNMGGFQLPFNGAAYAGVITSISFTPNYREYLGVQLSQPLQAGMEYFVSAFISRGDSTYGGEVFDCATNNFGFRFTTTKYEAINFNPGPVDNFSHIHSNDIILDSVNWTQIAGSFTADSAYNSLYIGNFYDAANTNVNTCTGTAYYYVDAVCVSTNPNTCDITLNLMPLKSKLSPFLYPNPAKDFISIKNLIGNCNYTIFNSTGKPIKSGLLTESNNLIDVKALPAGFYFIQVNNKHSYKFFISH